MSETTYHAVKALEKEVKRLNPHQGRIARRNARRAILGALRHVRNMLNTEFPKIERPSEDDPQFLVECFEKAHRETVTTGGRIGHRQIPDRWIVARQHFLTVGFPSGYYTSGGTMRSMSFKKAAKVARRLKDKMSTHTWRLRQVKTDTIVMADVL